MGYSKNENQHLSLDKGHTVSSKFEESKTYCVCTKCVVQEKYPLHVSKKVTQGNQDMIALYDDEDDDRFLMKKNTFQAKVAMNVSSSRSSRTIYTIQIATLFLAYACLAGGTKLQSDHIAKEESIYESLSTTKCNPRNLDMTQSCHVEGSYLADLLIDRCEFKDKCPPGYPPRCVDIDEGMVFICAPENTKCSEGYRWKVTKDKGNYSKVHVIAEECPQGTFQPSTSDCFHACKLQHEDLRNIAERYTVYTEGDNIHPTYVYCNYKIGYFNRGGDFLLNYDRDSEHNQYFCDNVNVDNPCVDGQIPLPNGTCVPPCKKTECRDDHNHFICQQTCRDQTKYRHPFTEVPDLDEVKDECNRETRTCQNGICKKFFNENICQCNVGFEYDKLTKKCIGSDVNPKTKPKLLETGHIVLIVVFSVIMVAILLAVCVVLYKRKKCTPRSLHVEEEIEQFEYSSIGTDEPSTVTESNTSIKSEENTPNRTKHNCPSVVFKEEAQNINIINNYVQCDENARDQCITDSRIWGNDRNRITAKGASFACQSDANDSTDVKKYELGPQTETTGEEGREYLLAETDEGRNAMSNVRGFKKDINDINTQAVVECLNTLMPSCGAIVHRGIVKGTAFRAGPRYVITAFHVIHDLVRDLTGRSEYDFALLEVENLTVNFNGSALDPHTRDIQLKYCYHKEVYDFAVLEIKHVGLHQTLPDSLLLWQHDISYMNGKQVILIGYGYAETPYVKHAETCVIIKENEFSLRHMGALASLNQNSEEYKNDIPDYDGTSVDRGYLGVESETFIKFDCFMEKGLSGGPVITNEGYSPKVIGIVKGGIPDFFYELSPEKKASFENKYLFEVGVKMQLIYETMKTENPELASELFNE